MSEYIINHNLTLSVTAFQLVWIFQLFASVSYNKILSYQIGYESAVDTSVNKQKGSSSTLNQQLQPSQSHHPQPPVPISGVLDKSFTLNNGPSGLSNQVPLRQSEDYSQVLKSNGAGGIVNVPRKNADIFSHKDGGIMDDAYTSHQQQQQMHN